MEFILAGIEARKRPILEWASADASEWDADKNYNDALSEKFKLKKNRFQLLQINNEIMFREVIEYAKSNGGFDLAILCVPKSIKDYNYKNFEFESPSVDINFFSEDLIFQGYDVCDLDGFYTILNCDAVVEEENTNQLIQSISYALEVAHNASVYEKNHSPYSIVKVFSVL